MELGVIVNDLMRPGDRVVVVSRAPSVSAGRSSAPRYGLDVAADQLGLGRDPDPPDRRRRRRPRRRTSSTPPIRRRPPAWSPHRGDRATVADRRSSSTRSPPSARSRSTPTPGGSTSCLRLPEGADVPARARDDLRCRPPRGRRGRRRGASTSTGAEPARRGLRRRVHPGGLADHRPGCRARPLPRGRPRCRLRVFCRATRTAPPPMGLKLFWPDDYA